MPRSTKKPRCRVNNAQRKEICEYSQKYPLAKHQEISEEFTRQYPMLKLDWSTISKKGAVSVT